MRRQILHFYLLLLVVLNAGCAEHARTGTVSPVVNVEKHPPAIEPAYAYYKRLQTATSRELQDEYETLRRYPVANDNVMYITRMALLFTVPTLWSDPYGEQRALKTLDQLDWSKSSRLTSDEREYLQFALVWKEVLKLRQQIRERHHDLDRLRDTLTELQEQNKELNRQIQALKLIEQQINQHERMQE